MVMELQAMLQAQRRKTVRNPDIEELIASLLYYFAPVARLIEHIVRFALQGPVPAIYPVANREDGVGRDP